MVSKFSSLIETWGITEEAVLNRSDYLLSSYRPCKQKDFFAALIFPSSGEDSQTLLAVWNKYAKAFISRLNWCETQQVVPSAPLAPNGETS